MKNYISINGNKSELTAEQLAQLGISTETPLQQFIDRIRSNEVNIHDTLSIGSYDFEIIGLNHENEPFPNATLMAKQLVGPMQFHDGECSRGWIDSDIRKRLNGEVYESLPSELRRHIICTEKNTHSCDGEVYKTTDKLFLPSESEMFGSAIWSGYEDGKRYEAFATRHNRIRVNGDGNNDWYWTRSPSGVTYGIVARVGHSGHAGHYWASPPDVFAPLCFRVA